MGRERKESDTQRIPSAGMSSVKESYNIARLIRQGNRELERQYNSKRTRREK